MIILVNQVWGASHCAEQEQKLHLPFADARHGVYQKNKSRNKQENKL